MTVIELPTPPAISIALTALVDCVCEQLETNGAGPTCWCGLYPGAIVEWNYCAGECGNGVCGMGWVRLGTIFPYTIFPQPILDDRCTLPLAWQIEVGALRCVPQMPDGSPVDVTTMADVALAQLLDARALHAAMQCCGFDITAEVYTPTGPEGGCVGGFWTGYIALS